MPWNWLTAAMTSLALWECGERLEQAEPHHAARAIADCQLTTPWRLGPIFGFDGPHERHLSEGPARPGLGGQGPLPEARAAAAGLGAEIEEGDRPNEPAPSRLRVFA